MRMTPTVILVGILALLAAITSIMVYWPYKTMDRTPSEIFRARTEVEEAGRKIYLENGCVYCHSQAIRAWDWGHGADRIAQPGDYIADEPMALGSQRTGVDLSQEGGEHPDDWHIAHFINPRYTRPSFHHAAFRMAEDGPHQYPDSYIQSLGFKNADRRMQRQRYWKAESIKAYEAGPEYNARWLAETVPEGWRNLPNPYPTTKASLQRGHKIYQKFCIGCHGPIGDGMGPAQPWIYPPPLELYAS